MTYLCYMDDKGKRRYRTRYDYEGVDKAAAEEMMSNMRSKLASTAELGGEPVELADDFTYMDPVDGSTTSGQGIRVLFTIAVYLNCGGGERGARAVADSKLWTVSSPLYRRRSQ